MTVAARRATIKDMMMSPHTHVALTYAREQELRERVRHTPTTARREVTESSESVGRLRRRLAQMHLAAALPQG